jgi:hypothetical protein
VPEKPAAPEGKDPVKELLDSIDNPDNAWGDPWASFGSKKDNKKKRDSVAGSSNVDEKALTRVNTKSSKASKEDDWDDWGTDSKKDKKTDPKIMKAEGVDEPDADRKNDNTFGFAFTNKRDKKISKKKGPVEAIDDDTTPLQQAETVEEQKSSQEDSDWAFASNRVKAKRAAAKAGTKSAIKAIEAVARAPSLPDDAVKAIEPAPEEPQDDDELAPDDSASVTKEPAPKVESAKKKEEKPKASSMWGGLFGKSSAPKTPTLSQLRKEREEREKKDREEREKKEQQDREEKERLESERVEAENAEQERLE